MKSLYDVLSYKVSRETTTLYSTSFSLGIRMLAPPLRPAIYAIYGYVRLADEIVDSFHDYDKAELLKRFAEQTQYALDERISFHPILQAFQETVHRYQIDRELIELFLASMEMDLYQTQYERKGYEKYILGSAEVVGLMCLHVFVHGNKTQYEKLKPYAMKLGSAFQKINFLRDLKNDYQQLGRTYFPNVDVLHFEGNAKKKIEREIEQEFKDALTGIRLLPASSRFGVYLAYKYYVSLFRKIQGLPAQKIMLERIRISDSRKLWLALTSYLSYKFEF